MTRPVTMPRTHTEPDNLGICWVSGWERREGVGLCLCQCKHPTTTAVAFREDSEGIVSALYQCDICGCRAWRDPTSWSAWLRGSGYGEAE